MRKTPLLLFERGNNCEPRKKNKPGNYTEQISLRAHIGSIHRKESKSKRKKPATSEKENFIVRSLRPPQASKCVCVCIFPYKCPCVRKTKLVLVAPPRRVFFSETIRRVSISSTGTGSLIESPTDGVISIKEMNLSSENHD